MLKIILKVRDIMESLYKVKILTVSIVTLLIFGILLNVLSYFLQENEFVIVGIVLMTIAIEMYLSYVTLHQLHRDLLVIRYRKWRKNQQK